MILLGFDIELRLSWRILILTIVIGHNMEIVDNIHEYLNEILNILTCGSLRDYFIDSITNNSKRIIYFILQAEMHKL